MNITDCFQMRKRRSVDKTPGRSHEDGGGELHVPLHGGAAFADVCWYFIPTECVKTVEKVLFVPS